MPEKKCLVQHYTGNWYLIPSHKRPEWVDAWADYEDEPVWADPVDINKLVITAFELED